MEREPFAQQLSAKWTGAAFFWLLSGFKGKYVEQLDKKYAGRNLWTGYILNLLFAGFMIYLFIKKS
jgi:hypothetical protein